MLFLAAGIFIYVAGIQKENFQKGERKKSQVWDDFDEEMEFKIVGSTEANSLQNKISNEAPIGRALLGKKIGDVVSVEGINQVNDFRVIDVQRK